MDTENRTPFEVLAVPMIDREGRPIVVVITKGTYEIGADGTLAVANPQVPIAFEDEFVGPPRKSPMRMASDIVDVKPATDVVAVLPAGFPKGFSFLGRRIVVEVGPVRRRTRVRRRWTLGPVPRGRRSRRKYAGSYDRRWREDRMPILPTDFDPRHNLVAPSQQVARGYLRGDEEFELANLVEGVPRVWGRLPGRVAIVAGSVLYEYFTRRTTLDTVLFWSDAPRVTLVWRLAIPCQQKVAEVGDLYVDLVRLQTADELLDAP